MNQQSQRVYTDFPVVGIGASAGGLKALREFFSGMSADSGLAFVVIQHLDPTHQSMTPELLARCTAMTVAQVEDQMKVEPNCVYVIPPNTSLAIEDTTLHLGEPVLHRGMRMPMDHFFRSLAADRQHGAIGIVLSGTGTDGTLGINEIKGAGGMVMAQSPETAEYDGMSRSAIASGSVDHVLPVAEMPEVLLKYVECAYIRDLHAPETLVEKEPDHFHAILALLKTRTKFDFRGYKRGTLLRRINRRMGLNQVTDLADYVAFLREHSKEVTQLYRDLLIGVTNFFRDPEAFQALDEQVISKLVEDKPPDATLRVWVPGCASGEEAYSLAMLLTEHLHRIEKGCPLQVFGSDVDEDALGIARAGRYPENIAGDIPPDRLRRFFSREGQSYRVTNLLREPVVFARQNLITDPPFSRLDLISCRNLLIYLQPDVQRKVLSLFHFALEEAGCLFLGSAETVGQQTHLFQPVSTKWRIYRRVGVKPHHAVELPLVQGAVDRQKAPDTPEESRPVANRPAQLTERLLLEDDVRAAVLINAQHQILYTHGPVDRYLKQPSGVPSDDLSACVREGLLTQLRGAIQQALEQQESVEARDAHVRRNGDYHPTRFTVRPVKQPKSGVLLLITFEPDEAAASQPAVPEPGSQDESPLVRQLEHELEATKQELRHTVEDAESSNEELKAANEEVMSINEELQSTNEELETSKEELQSVNEELITVNSQLESKVRELEAVHDDMTNLLNSTDIATLFLDQQGHIKRFTPAMAKLINVIDSDVGRPISDIANPFSNGELQEDVRSVLNVLSPVTREVHTQGGRWYLRRILPYRTQDNRINGVVVTFTDITERQQANATMQEAKEAAERANHSKSQFLAAASHDLRQPLQTVSLLNEVLSTSVEQEAAVHTIDRQRSAIDAMQELLDALLDISKLEAGAVTPEIREFQIAPVLASMRSKFESQAEAKGLRLRVAPCALTVRSDPSLLEQIIQNLLVNAIKHTETGRVLLGCRRRGPELCIGVWDTGVGIPHDQLERIFESFYQLDNPGRDRRKGLGLGLAIVKDLARLLEHRLEVQSTPGKGSVFAVHVPIAQGATSMSCDEAQEQPAGDVPLHGLSILLIEDDIGIVEALELFLESKGVQLLAASNADDALARAQERAVRPDLAIADYRLPQSETGTQALQRVREAFGRDLPTLLLTGETSPDWLPEARRMCCKVLYKPIEGKELLRHIRRLLAAVGGKK